MEKWRERLEALPEYEKVGGGGLNDWHSHGALLLLLLLSLSTNIETAVHYVLLLVRVHSRRVLPPLDRAS